MEIPTEELERYQREIEELATLTNPESSNARADSHKANNNDTSAYRRPNERHKPVRCTTRSLPRGWRKAQDANSGAFYFYCKALNRSQWSAPAESDSVKQWPLAPGWVEAHDPDAQREYYHNPHQNESTWNRPIDWASVVGLPRCKGCNAFGVGVLRTSGFCRHCMPEADGSHTEMITIENVQLKKSPAERAAAAERVKQHQHQQHLPPAKRKRAAASQSSAERDPMDPSSYSDAPVGTWGTGIPRSRGQK
jgi:polyglutamine-binding protein 1